MNDRIVMPAGKYYVGDLCYVMHGEWDECCGLFFDGHIGHGVNEGLFTLKDGRKFASFNTQWGDGTYYDEARRAYCVDAGLIGCILADSIDYFSELEWGENDTSGGQVIDFAHDFEVRKENGVLYFGDVRIDTAGYDEEYDD